MKHKSALETELKLRIPATGPFRSLLEALGFHEVEVAERVVPVARPASGVAIAHRDDLRLRLLGEVWVQQQQDLVVDHGFPFLLPSVLGGLTGKHLKAIYITDFVVQ